MRWKRKDYQGNDKNWYSQDVILKIREMATAGFIHYKYGAQNEYHACIDILDFLNEVDRD